jgi:hypothetical protein
MRAVASHQRYVHLYLNGLYWGVYELLERPDEAFSATYYGGEIEQWASVQSGFPPGGEFDLWNQLLSVCRAGLSSDASYMAVQGRNPDGTPNPAYTNHLDADSVIDYMIAHLYVANADWPQNNYWLGRERAAPSSGFKFYPWDAETSLDVVGVQANFTSLNLNYGVAEPYTACRQNLEFRVLFGDHVQAHFFNGGAFYTDPFNPRWNPARPEQNIPAARFVRLCDSIR